MPFARNIAPGKRPSLFWESMFFGVQRSNVETFPLQKKTENSCNGGVSGEGTDLELISQGYGNFSLILVGVTINRFKYKVEDPYRWKETMCFSDKSVIYVNSKSSF